MSKKVRLTVNQKRFIEEYCSNGYNATQAAISAGYSKKTARETGYENLTKPHIKSEINKRLDELTLTAEQLTKRTADIAKGNLSDYMVTRMVEHTPKIKVGLRKLIEDLKLKIDMKEEFASRKGISGDELEAHRENIESLKDSILTYEIELERNPSASRIVRGETELVPHVEVDMNKLTADKEKGIIKSFKHGKNGLEVELYPADAAIDRLMRVKGMYKDKLDITTNEESLNKNISPEEAKRILGQLSNGDFNVVEEA